MKLKLKFELWDKCFLGWIAGAGVVFNVMQGFLVDPAYFTAALWAMAVLVLQYLMSLKNAYLKEGRRLLEESMFNNWIMLARLQSQDRTGDEWKDGGSQ